MAWTMKLPNGTTVNSDDFTLENLGEIEDATGEPWSMQNPLRTVKSAKAFLKVAYRISGLGEADVDALTLGLLKTMFDFVEDKPFPGDDGGDDAAPLARSSSGSSSGASEGSTGSRRKPGNSA